MEEDSKLLTHVPPTISVGMLPKSVSATYVSLMLQLENIRDIDVVKFILDKNLLIADTDCRLLK